MIQNASTDSSISMSFGAPAEEISRRAYEIWENEGRPDGCDLRHWLQAEQELSARHAKGDATEPTTRVSPPTAARNTGTDLPLNATRAGAPRDAARETKRGSNSPFGAEKSGAGSSQNVAKRKPASAPVM